MGDGLYTLEELGLDVRTVIRDAGNDFEAVLQLGRLTQRFAQENDPASFWSMGQPARISSGLPGRKMYQDPDDLFTLLLAEYPPNSETAVHSHEGWVVINILRGSERYTSWRRADDGTDENYAKLEVAQDHHIVPGEFGYLFNDPFNVHRQAAESEGALELVLMSGRGRRLNHIDLATGDCSAPVDLQR